MIRGAFVRFIGWIGTLGSDDRRQNSKRAIREACEHGNENPCPLAREDFDCNDCQIDEGTSGPMPRM